MFETHTEPSLQSNAPFRCGDRACSWGRRVELVLWVAGLGLGSGEVSEALASSRECKGRQETFSDQDKKYLAYYYKLN